MRVTTRWIWAACLTMGVGLLASCSTSGDDADGSDEAAAVDVYRYAGKCAVLQGDDAYVRIDGGAWKADAAQGDATPFRMQATALGSYLLYGTDGRMVTAKGTDAVTVATDPGPKSDWKFEADGDRVRLANVASDNGLEVGSDDRLVQATGDGATWRVVDATGCATFPDIDPGVDGEPFTGAADAPVEGYLDAHTHLTAYQFLGGRFHCGRPWSPYGVEDALADCANHADGEVGAVTDGLLSTGDLSGEHDQSGWPEFTGWPNVDSLTHEGTYWRWIERTWRGGLRLMVTHLVENRALCEIFPDDDGTDCNEMASIADQAAALHDLQDYIDAQAGGPGKGFFRLVGTPAEARRVINAGKLAVVMGIEVSEVLDCGLGEGPSCDEASIDEHLDTLYDLGVRSVFPVHKFDNALGGTMYDGGLTGVFVNVGNRYATGEWWAPRTCAADETPDNTVLSPGPLLEGNTELVADVLGDDVLSLIEGDLPEYPEGDQCNPKGLSKLGAYAVQGLIDRHMIVETDHLSAKARDGALTVLEKNRYPGVISSHTWDDLPSRKRLQALGGIVAPYAGTGYTAAWKETIATYPDGALAGIGYASDTNGLAPQPDPRENAAENPVTYPFKSFDGGSTIRQQVSGKRTYDVNVDGAAHYGLFLDWIEDLRITAGQELIDDMANGAEAYLKMWEAAVAAG